MNNLCTGHTRNIENLNAQFFQDGIHDAELIRRVCENISTVVQMAASIGRQKSLENPQEDSSVNSEMGHSDRIK